VPKLLRDIANTPSLHGAHIVIEDTDPASVPRMVALVEHIASLRDIPLSASGTTDQREALDGADFVVVAISTGGFDSMRHDLEIPERYGVHQTIGDTVGPGGITRALRNIPVLVGMANDMESVCPDAWLLSVTNPMTTLCRAVTRETSIKTVGLCHEITITHLLMSLLSINPWPWTSPTASCTGSRAGKVGPSATSWTGAGSNWTSSRGSACCPVPVIVMWPSSSPAT
jgi:alpha-galactosidase